MMIEEKHMNDTDVDQYQDLSLLNALICKDLFFL
jgi:hypothetical protein